MWPRRRHVGVEEIFAPFDHCGVEGSFLGIRRGEKRKSEGEEEQSHRAVLLHRRETFAVLNKCFTMESVQLAFAMDLALAEYMLTAARGKQPKLSIAQRQTSKKLVIDVYRVDAFGSLRSRLGCSLR